MAEARATFSVDLEDGTSGAANAAANSLASLREKINSDTAALRDMQATMRSLKGGTSTNIEAFRNLRSQIDAKKASVAAASEAYVKLGGVFGTVNNAAGQNASTTKLATRELGKMIGQTLGLDKAMSKFAASSLFAAGATVALVAAVAIAAVGLAVGIVKLAEFAFGAADAARSQRLLLDAAAGSEKAGVALEGAVDRVSASVAIGRSKVEEYAKQLARAKFAGAELEKALAAVATVEATGGDASAVMKQLEAARAAGQSVDALTKKIQTKLGPIARAQMLSMSVQTLKAKEALDQIFKGVKIDGFLAGMHEVLGLFDQTTVTGQALKQLFETILQPIFDGLAKLAPEAKAFFQGMVIAGLVFAIAVLKIKKALEDAFSSDALKGIDWVRTAMFAGIGAGAVFVGILGLLAGVAISVGVALLPVTIAIVAVAAAIYGAVLAVQWLISAFSTAYNAISSLDFGALATGMIDGFVNGITAGIGRVVEAVKNLGSSAVGTLKGFLGIASPSKVFGELGAHTAGGFASGVEGGGGKVDDAVSGMVSIPSGGGGGNVTNNRGGNVVHITIQAAGGAAQEIAAEVRKVIADVFEGAAITMGAPLDPEPV